MIKKIALAAAIAIAMPALWPPHLASRLATAGGLTLPGTGAEAVGRGGAFVAKADDPSALHHNPAGLAHVAGTVVYLGANFLDFSLTFDRAGQYQSPDGLSRPYDGQEFEPVENNASPGLGLGSYQAVPLFVVASDLGGRVPNLRLAAGILAPNAYPNRDFGDYEFDAPGLPPPPQRYDIVKQEAVLVEPSLAAAYSIGKKLDIGARLSWGIANLKATSYTWTLRNYDEYIGDDAEFVIDATDRFVPSFALGVLFRPTASVEIGAAYSNGVAIAAKGTSTALLGENSATGEPDRVIPIDDLVADGVLDHRCAAGGTPEALKGCIDYKLPRTATVGARWIVARDGDSEVADVELDVAWEDWSSASDIVVNVDGQSERLARILDPAVVRHGFQDVVSIRLGGAYALPIAERAIAVRGGIAHDTAAAPNSWQRVDIDGAARTMLSGGFSLSLSRFRLDLAGGVVLEGDRTVAECNPNAGAEGCPPGSGMIPPDQRENPDPVQPILDTQFQSPFNGGDYSSGYVIFSLGLTAQF